MILLLASGCGARAKSEQAPAPSASAQAAPASSGVVAAAGAESRRDAAAITDELFASQRLDERRAVARALSRIGSTDAKK